MTRLHWLLLPVSVMCGFTRLMFAFAAALFYQLVGEVRWTRLNAWNLLDGYWFIGTMPTPSYAAPV